MKSMTSKMLVICLAVATLVATYCMAQTVQKKSQPQRPRRQEISAIARPFDPKRAALDQKYENLTELRNRALATSPAAAENYYRQATVVDPYPTDAWLGLARASDSQGKTLQALTAYRRVFNPPYGSGLYSSFPADVEALARYGSLSEEAGQHESAMKAYGQAVETLNPKPDVPLPPLSAGNYNAPCLRALLDVVRGVALAGTKEHDGQDKSAEALQAFQSAAQQYPNDARVQFYLGYGLRKAGQFAQAQAAFQRAAQMDTDGTVKTVMEENLRAVQAHRR